MNITRRSEDNGLPCSACHRSSNSPETGGPPGAPHWQLPPPETPMVFAGRTPAALCRQIKDPAQTGGRTLAAILHHVEEDPLVLWAWNAGAGRAPPPVSHAEFVVSFRAWMNAGAPCP